MTPPITRTTALIQGLAAYLKSSFEATDPTITMDWLYYADVLSPNDPPKGAIWLDQITATESASRQVYPNYRFRLRLLVGATTEALAQQYACSWLDLMVLNPDSYLEQLNYGGLTGSQGGIDIAGAFTKLTWGQWDIRPEAAQDPSAIVVVSGVVNFVDYQ